MPHRSRTLYRSTLALIILGPLLFHILIGVILGGRLAIEVGNAILLSLSAGITVTFFPVVWEAFRSGQLVHRDDAFAVGICLEFFALFLARVYAIVWRAYGTNPAWLDSVSWGASVALSIGAALCLMVAPSAIGGKIPPERWIRLGVLVAVGTGAFSFLVWIL